MAKNSNVIVLAECDIPAEARAIADAVVAEFSDIEDQCREACLRLEQHLASEEIVWGLCRLAMNELVSRRRCAVNRQIKNATGQYNSQPNTGWRKSPGLRQHYKEIFQMNINGTQLGLLKLGQLEVEAEKLRSQSKGLENKARLCQEIRKMCLTTDEDRLVMDSVPPAKVQLLWDTIKTQTNAEAA